MKDMFEVEDGFGDMIGSRDQSSRKETALAIKIRRQSSNEHNKAWK